VTPVRRDGGSYRDPSGYVFYQDGRVYRAIMERARADYEAVRDIPLVGELIRDGIIIGCRELKPDEARHLVPDAAYVVEHDAIPFISYPFEWPFALLQRAARFHLDLQLRLLDAGVMLSDATAYNVQFLGSRPVFIDLLSLRPYRDGELWLGHHQFMQQFMHPLLLNALAGVTYNNWYKGNLDGIRRNELVQCLPALKRLTPRVFKQVVLPQMVEAEYRDENRKTTAKAAPARLDKTALISSLRDLDAWIATLSPKTVSCTTWSDYEKTRTYDAAELDEKRAAVAEFTRLHTPSVLWDIGCNTGEFSELALQSGCNRVIGFDLDEGALHLACDRAQKKQLDLLPLSMDLLNPSSGCGWLGAERKALVDRELPDAIVALALIHHLAIAGNTPLGQAVDWLVSLAPKGIIEFVHKTDETVQRMLRFREDIFDDYHEEAFRQHLEAKADILDCKKVSASGRSLYIYQRR
jgi:ribosomal protein L11 methylase PrmA